MVLAAVHVAPGTFFAIIAASALAGSVTAVASEHRVLVPLVFPVLGLRLRGDLAAAEATEKAAAIF
jgi:hypothetical protein